ncbi:PREDICTED: uncharacterized protein LOC109581934 [Amphimedon queenslandica]|uniref:Uncharacterized protein n=1 Tax=Amphimedon queenslandica TaxID=400682 RepID=A0AAN0J5K1_AMPQE|nr:PREDICTED: uncharacterized protein LOC109581934 [Amphimedon queenslandica]|eukprot:XP_019851998.1 PREDICTED: uncharacterized protein LOC109581934 [Amphimedon queenslandica]
MTDAPPSECSGKLVKVAMATHATGQGSSSGSSQASQAPHPSGTSSRIDVNNATRAHPLFGMLDYIIRNTQNQTSKLETRISTLEKNVDKIIDIQGELKQLMEEYCDSTFSIEKTSYQAPLRKGAAILFCNSMFRTPTEDSVLKMVKATLRSDIHSKRILHASLKFTNSLFVTFRSEERRRILHPSGKYRNKDTKSLAALIMGYMKANTDSCPNYTRNLALLRKFIRDKPSIFTEKKSFTVHLKLG